MPQATFQCPACPSNDPSRFCSLDCQIRHLSQNGGSPDARWSRTMRMLTCRTKLFYAEVNRSKLSWPRDWYAILQLWRYIGWEDIELDEDWTRFLKEVEPKHRTLGIAGEVGIDCAWHPDRFHPHLLTSSKHTQMSREQYRLYLKENPIVETLEPLHGQSHTVAWHRPLFCGLDRSEVPRCGVKLFPHDFCKLSLQAFRAYWVHNKGVMHNPWDEPFGRWIMRRDYRPILGDPCNMPKWRRHLPLSVQDLEQHIRPEAAAGPVLALNVTACPDCGEPWYDDDNCNYMPDCYVTTEDKITPGFDDAQGCGSSQSAVEGDPSAERQADAWEDPTKAREEYLRRAAQFAGRPDQPFYLLITPPWTNSSGAASERAETDANSQSGASSSSELRADVTASIAAPSSSEVAYKIGFAPRDYGQCRIL